MSRLARSRQHPAFWVAVCSSVLCSSLLAQAPVPAAIAKESAPPVITPARAREGDHAARRLPGELQRRALAASGAALVEQDGTLWGIGDHYKTRFSAQGFEFIPKLGPRAAHNYPVEFRLLSVGRGEDRRAVEAGTRRHDGLQVVYPRGDFAERYDVKPEGIEQSFVFDRLPAGHGDLVVRGALVTELVATRDGAGYKFELPGVGGLHFGGVTGIDAAGNRVAGRVDLVDGAIELSLPASFVANAVLPLVLDPLVGSVFHAFTGDLDDREPDVAYDVTNDVFLVVYESLISQGDTDVHGQRVSGAGALVGTRVFIEVGTADTPNPKVASVNRRDRFVVVYDRGGDIKGRFVNAATARVLAQFDVASGTDDQITPDIGGTVSPVDDGAICVWANTTLGRIEACQIHVSADDTSLVWDLTTIYESGTTTVRPVLPCISKSGGSTGHHCIVFGRNGMNGVLGPVSYIVDQQINVLDSLRALDVSSTPQPQNPAVDGDGRHWVVAWQSLQSGWDINCRALSWDPAAGGTSQGRFDSAVVAVTANPNNDDERAPSVVWCGGSVLVGWNHWDRVDNKVYFQSLDPFTCMACESGRFWLAGSQAWDGGFAGCSKASGGGSEREALLAIASVDFGGTGTSNIDAQQWRSDDGLRTDLGGGCGPDVGDIYTTCARAGHAGFEVRLLHERSGAAAVLVVSRDRLGLPCGICRLIPDPYTGIVHFAVTDSGGQAGLAAPIPATSAVTGISFYAQWLVAQPFYPGCYLFDADLTRAIRVTIQ